MATTEKQTPTTWDDYVKQEGRKPVTVALLDAFMDHVLSVLQDMNERNRERNARLAALEARPASGGVRWAGTWKSNRQFREGELCTWRGGLWLATRTTNDRPGTDDSGFRLIVKSGSVPEGADDR